jgi:hypothetical protein
LAKIALGNFHTESEVQMNPHVFFAFRYPKLRLQHGGKYIMNNTVVDIAVNLTNATIGVTRFTTRQKMIRTSIAGPHDCGRLQSCILHLKRFKIMPRTQREIDRSEMEAKWISRGRVATKLQKPQRISEPMRSDLRRIVERGTISADGKSRPRPTL